MIKETGREERGRNRGEEPRGGTEGRRGERRERREGKIHGGLTPTHKFWL